MSKKNMKLMVCGISVVITCFISVTGCSAQVQLDKIELPPGFSIDIYADDLPGARSLALGSNGTLFIGTRADKVYAVRDEDGDNRADKKYVVARKLYMPNGVAFRKGDLYVAEVNRVLRYPDIERRLAKPGKPEVINDQLPKNRHHGWKFIGFGPDDLLYVPIGAPCNICEPGDPYAAILRMRPDGTNPELFARGVRNSVGFDWHPESNELWFTDNGRDMMGDDIPPDELNHASEKGLHFGYPYWHGGDVPDPQYGLKRPKEDFVPPALKMAAHVAPLGMRFYTGSMFPERYRGYIFVAQHGSWNRTTPIGYRILTVKLNGNKVVGSEVFADGWLQGIKVWGRPVDVLVMPDGALLVSDDKAGVIYRISYRERQ